jgi:hypothetical protein
MDTWESFFREKSRRRAAFRDRLGFAVWTSAAAALVAAVAAIVAGVNSLL